MTQHGSGGRKAKRRERYVVMFSLGELHRIVAIYSRRKKRGKEVEEAGGSNYYAGFMRMAKPRDDRLKAFIQGVDREYGNISSMCSIYEWIFFSVCLLYCTKSSLNGDITWRGKQQNTTRLPIKDRKCHKSPYNAKDPIPKSTEHHII